MPTRPSPRSERLGTPNTPAIRFARGPPFGASLVRICYGLSGCSPPWTDLTGFPRPPGAFTSRLPTGRSPFPPLDMTTTATGLLCWRDFHPQEWQLASLHQILEGREVQKALVGGNVRDVGQPHGVGSLGHKGAAQPIGRYRQVVAAVRGLGPASPTTLGLQAHVTHQPFDPASRMPVPLAAQFSVDAGRAIDPALGRKDPADVPAQLGVRLRVVVSGRDRAQPRVKARDACADDPAQRRNGMVGALGCHKGKLAHAIPRAKKAAASRMRRSISASSAFFWASASAEPAASCSLRHWLSWPGLTSSSTAMSASGLPLSITR